MTSNFVEEPEKLPILKDSSARQTIRERDSSNNNRCFRFCKRLDFPYWKLLFLAFATSTLSLANFGIILTVTNIPVNLFIDFINNSFAQQHGGPPSANGLAILWGITVSIPYGTAILGSLCVVPMAHKWGRKYPLMLHTNFVVILGSALCAFTKISGSFELLIVGRAVCGLAMGSATTLLPMYLVEISPTRHRGFVASLHGLCSGVSIIFALVLSYPTVLGNDQWWPLLVSIQAFFAFAQMIVVPLCPESPQYLYISKNRQTDARDIIRKYFGPYENIEDAMATFREEASLQSKQVSLAEALKQFHIRQSMFLGFVAGMTQNFSAANVLTSYVTLAGEALGFSDTVSQNIAVAGVVIAVPGVILGPKVVAMFRRRHLLIGGLTVMETTIVLGFIFALYKSHSGDMWAAWLSVIFFLICYCIYNFGPGPISWFIGPELCPEQARSVAAAANLVGVYSSALITMLLYPVLQKDLGPFVFLVLFAVPCGLCIWILYKFLPETNGRTVSEIVAEIERRHGGFARTVAAFSPSQISWPHGKRLFYKDKDASGVPLMTETTANISGAYGATENVLKKEVIA